MLTYLLICATSTVLLLVTLALFPPPAMPTCRRCGAGLDTCRCYR